MPLDKGTRDRLKKDFLGWLNVVPVLLNLGFRQYHDVIEQERGTSHVCECRDISELDALGLPTSLKNTR